MSFRSVSEKNNHNPDMEESLVKNRKNEIKDIDFELKTKRLGYY